MNALLPHSTTSRLDVAKRKAAARLGKLATRQQAAMITASTNPKIISGFTDHIGTLRRALAEIPATDFPADLSAALHLAEQLIADNPDSPIYVYTGESATSDSVSSENPNIHIVRVGQPIDNLAITRFQPRRLPERATDYEIFVEVVNFGTETVSTQLEIDCDGDIIDVLPLSLEPHKPVVRIVRNTSSSGGLFRATLVGGTQEATSAEIDLFPTDNVAIAFLSEQFVQRVLLYGEDNFFLWHVLQAQPHTEIVRIEEIPPSIPLDSVLILHQTIPPVLPPGNILVIDPLNDCDLFQIGERLERPIAATIHTQNSLVRFVQPGLLFSGARTIIPQKNNLPAQNTLPSDNFPSHNTLQTLAETADQFPLYLQFISEHQRTLVLSVNLSQGDFSLRTAFPILISQALSYFRNSEELQKAYSTAESMRLTLPTEKTTIILRSPSGHEETFPCQNGFVSLGRLGECGIWTILDPESRQELTRIACNLFNAAESNLRSLSEMPLPTETTITTLFIRPIWFYLALFALLLTTTEWFLYQRRWIE
jgi:hypothetical protein